MSETADIQSLVQAALAQPQVIKIDDGRTFAILPAGNGSYKLEQISLPNAANVIQPKIVTQWVRLQTAESLAVYINRFKNADTMLFANIAGSKIDAILDYHRQPTANLPAGATPADEAIRAKIPTSDTPIAALGSHSATLTLPFSLEWQTWTKASGQLMSHLAFSTFLEENAIDVVSPAGADLLELCRDLQVAQNVNFGSSVRMGDVTSFEYKKDSDATTKGSIKLPQSIMLSIPVYFGERPVSIMAFMRRKIDDGKLLLGIQLSRAENVRQDEFHRIVDAVTTDVDHLTTVYGTPS